MRPTVLLPIVLLPTALAGPVAYGICQSGCAGLVMACYAGAGAVWGATAGLGAAPAVLACNAAFGACSAKCAI
ncbi:hypothetical protein Q9L58_010353, partial [Maublancomyces gigas]